MIKRKFKPTFTWPVCGTIRKGGKKVSDNRPGPDLDELRFVGESREAQDAFEAIFHKDTVPSLPVYLAYSDIDRAYSEWCEKWARSQGGESKLMHRCDSETMVKWWDAAKKDYSFDPKPCDGGCKPVGRLRLVILELAEAGIPGDVMLTTTSWNDVATITGMLDAVQQVATERGVPISHIPLILRRSKRGVSHVQDGRKMTVQKSLLEFVLADRVLSARQAATVDASIAENEPTGEDGEWLETGDDTAPDFGEEDASTDGAPMAAEDKLPPAQGGPGWQEVPAQKAKFEAVCAKNGVVVNKERNDLKAIFGPAKIGTYALSTVIQTIEDWAASQAN